MNSFFPFQLFALSLVGCWWCFAYVCEMVFLLQRLFCFFRHHFRLFTAQMVVRFLIVSSFGIRCFFSARFLISSFGCTHFCTSFVPSCRLHCAPLFFRLSVLYVWWWNFVVFFFFLCALQLMWLWGVCVFNISAVLFFYSHFSVRHLIYCAANVFH